MTRFDLKENARELINRGVTTVPFQASGLALPAIEAFRRFLNEDYELRSTWTVDRGFADEPDDGYTEKSGGKDEKPQDHKHTFHYRPPLEEWLRRQSAVGIDKHRELLNTSRRLFYPCNDIATNLMMALDQELPPFKIYQKYLEGQNYNKQPGNAVRLVCYKGVPNAYGSMGKKHTDKSFLTIAVAESSPGLQLGEQKELCRVYDGIAIAFLGDKAQRLTGGVLKAVPHEVPNQEQNLSEPRWAVVDFIHTYEDPILTQSKL